MNVLLIRELVRIAIAAIGFLSVYCGYKLFCELPFARNRTAVLALSGALLALFGVVILAADIHGLSNRFAQATRPPIQQIHPADPGSFTPHMNQNRPAANWAI